MAKDHDDLSPAALPELNHRAESYERSDDEKKIYGDDKDDSRAGANVVIEPAEQDHLADVLAMEERIQKGTATKEVSGLKYAPTIVIIGAYTQHRHARPQEYAIRNNHDVAIKVLSTYDDETLPAITFRSLFLGLGFSCFGAVLAQIYYFKPQTIVSPGLVALPTGHVLTLYVYLFAERLAILLVDHDLLYG
jgi:hypothetical protein